MCSHYLFTLCVFSPTCIKDLESVWFVSLSSRPTQIFNLPGDEHISNQCCPLFHDGIKEPLLNIFGPTGQAKSPPYQQHSVYSDKNLTRLPTLSRSSKEFKPTTPSTSPIWKYGVSHSGKDAIWFFWWAIFFKRTYALLRVILFFSTLRAKTPIVSSNHLHPAG